MAGFEEHLAEMELEIDTMNLHGHLKWFNIEVAVKNISYAIQNARDVHRRMKEKGEIDNGG